MPVARAGHAACRQLHGAVGEGVEPGRDPLVHDRRPEAGHLEHPPDVGIAERSDAAGAVLEVDEVNNCKVSSTPASTAVVWEIPSANCTFASSTYQSQNSSQAKWYNASPARLNS